MGAIDFVAFGFEPALTPHRDATPMRAVGQTRLPAMGNAKGVRSKCTAARVPYEGRSRHLTGSGVAVISVDPIAGFTTAVAMEQSIGNRILDNSTVSAFRRWRLRPGSPSRVRIPITFLLTGAQY